MMKARKTGKTESRWVNVMHIEQEVTINAPASKVFGAIINDFAGWWGAPYLISQQAENIVLEPKLGGRLYESWGGAQGALWATVTRIKDGETLELTGPMGMSGAVHSVTTFTLVSVDKATLVRLSQRVVGEVSESLQQGYTQGWGDLLGVRLKAYVETGKRYGLGHEPPPRPAGRGK